jgi:hypothetical protein
MWGGDLCGELQNLVAKSITCRSGCFLFIYFILRHGAHGLWPKDEKESKKGETVTATKETRKHTNKQAKLLFIVAFGRPCLSMYDEMW